MRSFSRTLLPLFVFVFWFASRILAQVPDPGVAASAPIPGAGHHYIGTGTETVSPADGLLSFDLPIQTPAGRQLSLPFGFRYSSSEQFYLTNNLNHLTWLPRLSTNWGLDGWSYDMPVLTGSARVNLFYTTYTGQPPQGAVNHQCDASLDYVFRGSDGVQYGLNLGGEYVDPSYTSTIPPTSCNVDTTLGPSVAHGITATVPSPWTSWPTQPPITVYDHSGTVYQFSSGPTLNTLSPSLPGPVWTVLPSTITDRNGNQITQASQGFKDTLGRNVVSWTGFGNDGDQVSISGLSANVTLHWTNVPITFPGSAHTVAGSGGCSMSSTAPSSLKIVNEIDLPNGQKYTFSYDPAYGRVSKITFPGGGYARYVWGLNTSSQSAYFTFLVQQQNQVYCDVQYDVPAVTDRYVSYDGSTEVLHQHFAYSTTWDTNSPWFWDSKTTTVTSTDLLTNQVAVTTYNYLPGAADPGGPYEYQAGNNISIVVPVEKSVIYQDGSGHTLKTVNKTWLNGSNPFALLGEQTILDNGQGMTSLRCYDANEQVTHIYEYGFQSEGAKPADPACASSNGLTVSAIGPLRRHTAPAYHNFLGGTPSTHIVNEPDTVTVYDGSSNQVKQTSFTYDGNAVVASGAQTGLVSPPGLRGNTSTITQWLSTGGSSPVTRYTYFDTGQVQSETDACGNTACSDMTGSNHTTTYSYADSYASGTGTPPGQTNTYLTQVTRPNTGVAHIDKFTWGFNDSLVRSHIDQNSQTTTYKYIDSLARPTETDYPDGGKTTFAYNDAPYNISTPSPSVTATKVINSTTNLATLAASDGLGHVIQTRLTSDPDGTDYTAAVFDGLGRTYQVYNPTRCSAPTTNCGENTWGVTTTLVDALGRTCLVVPPDGTLPTSNTCTASQPLNTVLTTYAGNCTTVTDEVGKSRKTCSDALGRLTQVLEDPAGLNYETDYGYDALNNLLCVAQKGTNTGSFSGCASIPASWRPRTFAYDSLSRLTSASNPESGTVTYSYDANGNLSSKTSPKPNQTGTATVIASYSYDALNRLTQKSFSDGTTPRIKYGYDAIALTGCAVAPPSLTDANPIGRRTAMCDGAGAESWSHDSMGRPLTNRRITNSVSNTSSYTYNLDGSLYGITYPVPTKTLNYTPGGAGRALSAIVDFGVAYSAHYAPNGSLCSVDSSWGNTYRHDYTFNNRFQPVAIQVWDISMPAHAPCTTIPSGSGDQLDLTYSYADPSGHNNGNVVTIANNNDMHKTQNFTYDAVNRLATASTLGTNQPWYPGDQPLLSCWGEQYSYDAWGNLSSITAGPSAYNGCTQESGFAMFATTKNQLQDLNNDYVYDSAGNLIHPGPTGTYTWDAENRLTSAGGVAYLYDGDGKRVGKAPASTPTQPNYLYWYGGGSNILQESDGAGNFLYRDYYFNGMLFDRQEGDNWVDHFFADALGNTRGIYGDGDPDGGYSDYYPFGGERPVSTCCPNNPGGVNVPFKFTAKERDSESGLDNFGARYDSSSMGRFMSPDSTSYSSLANPQAWNLYAYTLNNPLKYNDPSGHTVECTTNAQQCKDALAAATANAEAAKRVTTNTVTTKHSFLGIHWTTSKTTIGITGDINSFRALGQNAGRLADLVQSKQNFTFAIAPRFESFGGAEPLTPGGMTQTPSQGFSLPSGVTGAATVAPNPSPFDQDTEGLLGGYPGTIPGANIGETAAHELLGHMWGEVFGGHLAGTAANKADAVMAEDAVRATDPTRGQKVTHGGEQVIPTPRQ